jgi:hypothetical protein
MVIGIVEEILSQHPLQVIGLHPSDCIKRLTAVLAKSKLNLTFDADEITSRIDRVRIFEVLVQTSNCPRQVGVAADHRIEDFGRSKNISESCVCVFVLVAAIETHCGRKVTGFASMKDLHRVEDSATFKREGQGRTVEFGVQER